MPVSASDRIGRAVSRAAVTDHPRTGGCRFCGAPLRHSFVDLGMSPLCESFVPAERLDAMEPFYPLHVYVCDQCFLVQLTEYVSREAIFTEYAYFSSYSDSWLEHARRYVDAIVTRFSLGPGSRAVEVASNDGYLLQYFVARGIPALGIEPAANVAREAERKGVPTLVKFFGRDTARELVAEGSHADLLLGNNVLAQVPDLNDFVAGMALLLAPGGVITLEFPHLMRLVEGNQFDTIYHEHFSYFSLFATRRVFAAHGLRVFDVEEIGTHGGSLRIYGCHDGDSSNVPTPRVGELLRHSDGLPRLHGGPESVQAGEVSSGDAHPHPRTRAHCRDASRLRADPTVELEGRDHAAARVRARLGRAIRGADSRRAGVSVIFTEMPLAGVYRITPEQIRDVRGFFARTWCQRELAAHGLTPRLTQ